jgi:hypothetical protein
MTTLTVNIDNKKSEKAVKAVLDALGLSYNVDSKPVHLQHTTKQQSRPSAHNFLGKISEKDISLMEAAIQDGCEEINPDDWK